MVIMLVGWVACLFLVPSHHVRRSDGSRAAPLPSQLQDDSHWWDKFRRVAVTEVKHIIQLKDEWRIWVSTSRKGRNRLAAADTDSVPRAHV